MDFGDEFFPDEMRVLKPDGATFAIRAQVAAANKVLTPDVRHPIDEGDLVSRDLPNGSVEQYQVTQSHLQQRFGTLPAIYTFKVRKLSTRQSPDTRREAKMTMQQKENSVFVVHGRDNPPRDALYSWLRTVGLRVITWDDAEALTPGTKSNFEIVSMAIETARAVIVLFTPDQEVRLRRELSEVEPTLEYQPRANVLFEAGWALGAHRNKTLVVEVGMTHHVSDIDGFNNVRMKDKNSLNALANRLASIGCELSRGDATWIDPTRFAALFPRVP